MEKVYEGRDEESLLNPTTRWERKEDVRYNKDEKKENLRIFMLRSR